MGWSAPELGLLCGCVPSIAMILVSALLTKISVSKTTEAVFQKFSGGLILGAVAAELFPLILSAAPRDGWIGTSVGFTVGLSLLNSVDFLVQCSITLASKLSCQKHAQVVSEVDVVHPPVIEFHSQNISNVETDTGELLLSISSSPGSGSPELWLKAGLDEAEAAIKVPDRQQTIEGSLMEVVQLIKSMEEHTTRLRDCHISQPEFDDVAEIIDKAMHKLQYKLDRCGRLIQGAGVEFSTTQECRRTQSVIELEKRLAELRCTAVHLVDHAQKEQIDKLSLLEMIHHVKEMGKRITKAHESADLLTVRWRRLSFAPTQHQGSTLPINLIIPVTIDCFVDGFLIGVSVDVHPKAGYILAGANCLEMSFLGMAYSAQLSRCTGSPFFARQLALYLPCVLMWLAAGLGALVANASAAYPSIFISFVAFGVTALISLVCCELIIEARETQGEEPKAWIQLFIFAGIYIVLMTSNVIPE